MSWSPRDTISTPLATDPPHTTSRLRDSDPLLPQTLGSLFDAAFDLYKRHFKHLTGLVALTYVPVQLLLYIFVTGCLHPLYVQTQGATNPSDGATLALVLVGFLFTGYPQYGVPGLVSLLALIFLSGPLTLAVADLHLGRSSSIREAYRIARPFQLRLLGAWTNAGFALIGVFLLSLMLTGTLLSLLAPLVTEQLPNEIIFLITLLLIVMPYVVGCALLAQWYAFTSQLILLERQPLIKLTARNAQIVGSARFRRAWGGMLFLPIVTFLPQTLMLVSAAATLEALPLPPLAASLLGTLLFLAISLFFLPYGIIFLTLFYFENRVRREAFDLYALSALLPPVEPTSPPVIPPLLASTPRVPSLPVSAPFVSPMPSSIPPATDRRDEAV